MRATYRGIFRQIELADTGLAVRQGQTVVALAEGEEADEDEVGVADGHELVERLLEQPSNWEPADDEAQAVVDRLEAEAEAEAEDLEETEPEEQEPTDTSEPTDRDPSDDFRDGGLDPLSADEDEENDR